MLLQIHLNSLQLHTIKFNSPQSDSSACQRCPTSFTLVTMVARTEPANELEDNGCCFYDGVSVIVVTFRALCCSTCVTFFCFAMYRIFVPVYRRDTTKMLSTELQHIKRQKLWVSLEMSKTGNVGVSLYDFYSHSGIFYFKVAKKIALNKKRFFQKQRNTSMCDIAKISEPWRTEKEIWQIFRRLFKWFMLFIYNLLCQQHKKDILVIYIFLVVYDITLIPLINAASSFFLEFNRRLLLLFESMMPFASHLCNDSFPRFRCRFHCSAVNPLDLTSRQQK